ncbi:ATS16-like protein [Mya arenaria]|uniref:ATS16-like protein n=1 Tax=Mya arenaria TaxID=6604 RepID=A0ABY7DRT8_MYAAR|nr:ATS16-like protein [Mya arenaria]
MMGQVLLLMLYLLYLESTDAIRFPHINTVSQQEDVDVNISTISKRRIRSANGFPLDLDVRFTSNNLRSDLKLSINDVSDDVPVVLQRAGKMVSYRVSSEAAAFYMDVSNKAAFISGDRELLVQPPTFVNAGHSVTEIEDTSPTDTDFLVNPDFNASRAEQIVASNYKNSDRVKRQATDYEVEIFFVIDYSLYSFWYRHMTGTDLEKQTSAISAIKQFYAFVLNAMSVRYSSVTGSGYTISLVYAGISIATSSTDAPYVENNLQSFDVNGRRAFLAELVLPAFKDWGNTNLKQNYNFDVAMMFTGYEMGRFVNNEFYSATAGLAYTPGACSNLNYNINEDHFGAVLATIAAHELGHNLGAQHDGTVDGNGELCSSDDAYVMAPSFGVSSDEIKNLHRFSFSSCSIDYFTAYITTFNTVMYVREQPKHRNVRDDCPYGDRSTSCNAAFCPHYTDESRTVSCCQTCAATATTISTPTTTTPTTTSTTPTTITTTPITTTTAPTTTTTTPTTTTTSLTTTTTTPTATTTTRTTNTPTISTTTPTTSTTTPTTNTPTTIKSTPPPTTTTQTTITTTTTPPTTTTTTTITTTPPPTTTTPTTTTTTTPTKTTTSPTTATTTPTTTRTTNTPTTTRITLTPTTTTTTSPTTTITSPKTTTTSPTTATTSPITTSTSPTTATTTPPTTTTSLSTTTTTPTKTTTSPTTTISSPATMTTTKPTTFITTPTTTKPTTTATTPTTTTITTKRTRVTVVFPIFISPNLLQIFGLRMGQKVQNILIISLRRGVIADFEIVYEDSVQSIALFTEANIDLLTGKETVTILNETVSASSIQVNTTIVTNETSSGALVCALFEASGGQCDNGYECATVDGAPTCHRQKTSDEMTLIIVVVTGSLVFLLITSIVICVSVRERRKYNLPN